MIKCKNTYRLLVFYRELYDLLDIYFKGYLMITTEDIAITYLRLCNKIEEILDEPNFKDMSCDWRPIANLRELDPDYPEGEWEYGGKQICNNFLSFIEDLYVKEGEKKCSLSQEDSKFLSAVQTDIKKYIVYKKAQEAIFVQKNFQNKKSKMEYNDFWSIIHKGITIHAKKRFDDGYYADAVESACKELIYRVKNLYKHKTGEELDGKDLMFKAFHIERNNPNPILCLVSRQY
jgi:hypothetical protein